MSVTRCVAVLAILLGLVSRTVMAANAATPQIWFSIGGMGKPTPAPSWVTLFFQADAPWPEFMNHVHVVGIPTQVLARISDEDLAKVVARLKEKHVELGVEMLAQVLPERREDAIGLPLLRFNLPGFMP